jgi:hypothetical protein
MYKNIRISILLVIFTSNAYFAQKNNSEEKDCFVGGTFAMLLNFADDPEPPEYYQLNIGYRITNKDVVSLEIITWKYYEPLGVPLGQKKTALNFPGSVHAFGVGIAYKRFLWKRVFAQVHATFFKQNYLNEFDNKIQDGFQLFNSLRIGYQFQFFNNKFFIEPSIAMTSWPINTNLPDSFQKQENKWKGYFLGEPGLHFGFRF